MSRKKLEELSDLVVDEKVTSVLIPRLTELMTPIMKELLKEMVAELKSSLTEHMEAQHKEIISETKKLMSSLTNPLEEKQTALQTRIEEFDRHSRLSNLIFHGIPENLPTAASSVNFSSSWKAQRETEEETTSKILQVCHDQLNIDLTMAEISTAHRLKGGKSGPRPIIVAFTTRRARNTIFRAKKLLRKYSSNSPSHQDHIYINEHLTSTSAHLFALARKLIREKSLTSAWTSEGYVYVRKTLAPEEAPHRILSVDDFNKFSASLPAQGTIEGPAT